MLCIDAVGLEAHAPGPLYAYDRAKDRRATAQVTVVKPADLGNCDDTPG
jgi:hypothetical protein